MSSWNNSSNLSLVHPDDTTEQPITPVSNGSIDDVFNFRNSDYISSVMDTCDENDDIDLIGFDKQFKNSYPPTPEPGEIFNNNLIHITTPDFNLKIGDGKMEYIKDKSDREMFTNAWKAITFTNNWDFVEEQTDSFSLSSDPRIYEITEKMKELGYNIHSGISFGLSMRTMQYLVKYGEEEFKKMF